MFSTTVATLAEFRTLGAVWNHLLLSMEYPIVFLTWEWIYTWWEHFGANNREPVILVVYEGEHVRGILPLYAECAIFRDYWLSGRVLTHCSATDLFPDHVDLIAAPDHAGQCLDSILEFLSSQYRAWDVLQIPLVASSSRLMGWLHGAGKLALPAGLDIEPASLAYFIRIDGTFEDYLSRLDTKHRYNVRSRAKKLRERQDFRYASGDDDQVACLRRLFALHRKRAARKGIVSSFVDQRVHSFHEAFAARVADFGWLSLRELRRPDVVIASSYNFDFGGRVFSYQKGFDPEYERYGPGSVLMLEVIREAFTCQRLEYNFLQGDEAYKREWTRDRRILSNVTIYNNTTLGYASRGGFRLKQAAKHGLGIQGPVDRVARCTVEVAGAEVLRTCEAEWSALVDSMRYPTVFSSWEWICSWWQHFGARRELRLLMVRREGRLVAVLPLFSEAQFVGSHGRIGRVLGYAGAVELYPDPLDIISAQADAGECMEAVVHYLQMAAGDWDVVHFRYLAEGGDLLRGLSGAIGGAFPAERISAAPYIPIAGNYEEYLKELSRMSEQKSADVGAS